LQGGEKVLIYSVPTADRKDFMFTPALIQLSRRFNVPILPIKIKGTRDMMPMDRKMLGSGRISISAGKPAHFASPAELRKEIS
jgi:1-acyl-sn-glycerol-3-phosphate acyltransferase